MADMKETLWRLIGEVQDCGCDVTEVVVMNYVENTALVDYLIANGVTIPVRCAKCQHWHESKAKSYGWCCRGKDIAYASYVDRRAPDDFCSKGEPRCE